MNDDAKSWKTPDDLSSRVLSTLRHSLDLVENEEPTEGGTYSYGEILGIRIEKPAGLSDILVVTTTLAVMCGDDTSLYVFRRVAERWQLVGAQEANNYDDVAGALGTFQYVVSPPNAAGQSLLVTTNVNPWCSSNWQSLRYSVFRLQEDGLMSEPALQGSQTIYLGNEGSGTIRMQPEGFRVDFEGGQLLDPGILIRKHVVAYRVTKNRVERVPPFAREPEGFLDEWLDLPWNEAIRWVNPAATDRLQAWHKRLRPAQSAACLQFFTNFVFDPPACKTAPSRWSVGIEFNPPTEGESLPSGIPTHLYVTVSIRHGAYFLVDASNSAPAKCTQKASN